MISAVNLGLLIKVTYDLIRHVRVTEPIPEVRRWWETKKPHPIWHSGRSFLYWGLYIVSIHQNRRLSLSSALWPISSFSSWTQLIIRGGALFTRGTTNRETRKKENIVVQLIASLKCHLIKWVAFNNSFSCKGVSSIFNCQNSTNVSCIKLSVR